MKRRMKRENIGKYQNDKRDFQESNKTNLRIVDWWMERTVISEDNMSENEWKRDELKENEETMIWVLEFIVCVIWKNKNSELILIESRERYRSEWHRIWEWWWVKNHSESQFEDRNHMIMIESSG